MGCGPGKKRDPEELVDFQGSPPASSGMVHPHVQVIKQRQQEACMGEQAGAGKTQAQKKSTQRWK